MYESVAELLQRSGLAPSEVDQVVFGQVIPSLSVPNIAREIVLGTGMPRNIEAYSVARAGATSYQSTVNITESILAGVIDCGIAGGADSASDVPMAVSKGLTAALLKVSKARTLAEKLRAFSGIGPSDLISIPPALKELSTGLTMGESAEKMAKENGISRADQDAFAHRSHTLAAQAWADGRLRDEVMPVFVPPGYEAFDEDNLVRKDSELDAYAKLKPVFDRRYGTVTAGNSSSLTDGASALLLMTEKKAKALGYDVLGYVRSYAFAAVDPAEQLLMGPAYASQGSRLQFACDWRRRERRRSKASLALFPVARKPRLVRQERLGRLDCARTSVRCHGRAPDLTGLARVEAPRW